MSFIYIYKHKKQTTEDVWSALSVWKHKVLSGGFSKKHKTNPKREGDRETNLENTLLFEFTF